ncbi:Type II/IV secretion system ATPase TadZ/CpaE, associated with Flp pilus assembly [Desulfovibrio sp. DV]|uniref:AAA family ATPase n=1 Tax=Desulfovibrio sp. DV TaxID=1844708 RepID=UPI00094BB24D|nr:AAA family ATPase [Desulfovibrio sp. DV]OLN25562.1 Type II/IV secretion system ATPase TadZ/CpaE, associated with Flp pilus assembly [Desulfovibrio sp. DV]
MRDKLSVILDMDATPARGVFEECLSEDGDFEVLGAGEEYADLLVRELAPEGGEAELEAVAELVARRGEREVFLTAPVYDAEVLMRLMRQGVREFFPQPVNHEEVRMALWRFKERRESALGPKRSKQGRIVSIFGAKGGVGTTSLAVNLAAAGQTDKPGATVALMDMNLPFGEAQLFLDIAPKYHWGEVLGNISRLDATYLMSVMSRHPSGIYLLAPPSRLDDLQMATPENISKLLELMRQVFDTVVIDLGMYLDEITLKVMDMSDSIVLVCVQNLPCLANVRRFLDTIRHAETGLEDKLKIVVNRHLDESDLVVADMEKALGLPVFWRVPNDYKTTLSAINQGKTLLETAPRAPVTRSLCDLAAILAPAQVADAPKKTFFGLKFLRGRS